MKVFIMRHGEAGHFASSDAERELTPRGRSESMAVAHACVEQGFSEFDAVLVSPYVRAQQTWEAISEEFSVIDGGLETCDDITPYGTAEDVFEYVIALIDSRQLESVLLVSHLPLVGYLTSQFVADMMPPMFPTSGLACVEFEPETRQGELIWHMHP
ncbi:phosphohistidine phosphatase SixA [Vibrio albus]|jgi:phosphohistidine phosphatase|uniref:Phosphohistidine phosphatase SixA n=1 Tax=Vibrio albus TaxID=2200953 RepID=A0A2U3BC12_9VIBR|nr:phosphohistidine phosphatase SixA [Vibrio albus]PWI34336.1 phosphohistidine phosphatase SixA [Vibrio albus]